MASALKCMKRGCTRLRVGFSNYCATHRLGVGFGGAAKKAAARRPAAKKAAKRPAAKKAAAQKVAAKRPAARKAAKKAPAKKRAARRV